MAAIAARAEAEVIDGFIAFPVGSWRSVELLCDEVMPRLRALGLVGDGAGLLGRIPARVAGA